MYEMEYVEVLVYNLAYDFILRFYHVSIATVVFFFIATIAYRGRVFLLIFH